jgi:hypothetical protein
MPTNKNAAIRYQTKTKLPITNGDDIEHYLEGMHEQLEKLLVAHDGVMIIK